MYIRMRGSNTQDGLIAVGTSDGHIITGISGKRDELIVSKQSIREEFLCEQSSETNVLININLCLPACFLPHKFVAGFFHSLTSSVCVCFCRYNLSKLAAPCSS